MKKLSILFLAFIGLLFIGMYSAPSAHAIGDEIVITAKSKYSTNHNVQIPAGSIDEHLVFENNDNIVSFIYNGDGRTSTSNNIFNNSSKQVRLYGGSITILINNSEYLISKVELLNSPQNIEINGTSGTSLELSEPTNQVLIEHTASSGRTDIVSFKITIFKSSRNISAKVNQLFENNSLSVNVEAEYGEDVIIPVNEVSGSVFQFALVNNVINNAIKGQFELPITKNLEVSMVYSPEGKHAVLFVDSNGKLISNTWVDDGGSVIAPSVLGLSKPGFVIAGTPWLSNEGSSQLENITSSRVYTLQYLSNADAVTISVNGDEQVYSYNEVVVLNSSEETFKAWMENGKVVSTNPTYIFTALTNRVLVESTETTTVETKVVLSNDLGLREGYKTFVGQLNLNQNEVLVEYGLLLEENGLLKNSNLILEEAVIAKSDILNPATNEFMMSVSEDYHVVRAYVTVRTTEGLSTYYSDYQFSDVVIVTFDTTGGNELSPVAIEKGSVLQLPVNPTRASHDFVKWTVDGNDFVVGSQILEDITLTAEWLETLPTIEEVRALSTNTQTEFKGIVTLIDGNNLFVQDGTAAIYIYNANKPAGLEVGDEVRVKGYRAIYNGLQQIGSGATVTIENKGNVLPPLFNVTNISELTNSHQSLRISLDAIELSVKSQSGNNLVLTNGANDILIYAPSGSDIYNHIQSAVIGQKVLVHEAFVDWFNGLQLKIVEVEDLEFIEPSDEEKLAEVKADLVALYDEKSFNMDTAISLPIVGAYGVTIDWLLDPTDAIVEGKWKSVGTDGEIVLMTATLTLGDEEPVTVELQVNIVYVDETVPQGPVTIIDYTSTGNADLPNGWTSTGLGKDYSGSRLRFDDTGDNVVTNSLNILAGTVIEVTVEGNMNVGSGTGKGQLQILSGTTLLGTINLNTNPLTTYSIEITLSVSVEKLTFNFVKDNGNLGLGKIKVVTNPN